MSLPVDVRTNFRRTAVVSASYMQAEPELTQLAARLACALNAIVAVGRFYLAARSADGPAGERDTLIAFLVEMGYFHEASRLLHGSLVQVEELALVYGCTEVELAEARKVLFGRDGLISQLADVPNCVAFHWDEGALASAVAQLAGKNAVWLEGDDERRGGGFYRHAARTVWSAAMGSRLGEPPEDAAMTVSKWFDAFATYRRVLETVLEGALLGYLVKAGALVEPGT